MEGRSQQIEQDIKMAIEWEINTGTKSQQFDGKEIIKRSESSDSGCVHAQ